MTQKKSPKRRTQVKGLPASKKKLAAKEMKKVRGGFYASSAQEGYGFTNQAAAPQSRSGK